ncbi:hypothetical protein [Paenibacillus sp. JJ-223]|uniref:hypothetical protein n=1 Tax=Paenibacillus sp. JJ-223 TaxID=2905647 RepID=UPI001F41BC48|nr:hypothetical protein [Paenibacillus sp. JJ-223]CAH1199650.1 hypothetical protein PAECIP111890_01717 [Paenibacillus sp. JJ-223]
MLIFSRNYKIAFAMLFTFLLFISPVNPSYAESSEDVSSKLVVTEIGSATPKFETLAVKKWGPYAVRTRNINEFDGASVYTNSGVSSFEITDVQMVGVHAGEKANFTLSITDFTTGNLMWSKTFTEDVTGRSWNVSNVVPGRTYQVVITSNTNNDMDGGFWLTVDGYAYQ